MGKSFEKIPSFVWIVIILVGGALLVGALVGGFWITATVEGVGSLIMLALGWTVLRAGSAPPKEESSKLGVAVGIVFFAVIGLALDQPGNFIYNQPLEWIFCPADAALTREVLTSPARGGGIRINQSFTCLAAGSGQVSRLISMAELLAARFFEYVLTGYALLGLSRLYTRAKGASTGPKPK